MFWAIPVYESASLVSRNPNNCFLSKSWMEEGRRKNWYPTLFCVSVQCTNPSRQSNSIMPETWNMEKTRHNLHSSLAVQIWESGLWVKFSISHGVSVTYPDIECSVLVVYTHISIWTRVSSSCRFEKKNNFWIWSIYMDKNFVTSSLKYPHLRDI